MNHDSAATSHLRLGAYASLFGSVAMLAGAGLLVASGTDLWAALGNDDIAGYLVAIDDVTPILVANLSAWMLGSFILGVAGVSLSRLCEQRHAAAALARACFNTAVPLAWVSFMGMMSLVVQLGGGGGEVDVRVAEVVGWISARLDDLATALILGAGPFFLALAGRGEWMPRWLERWGYFAGLTGLFAVAILFLPALSGFSLIIVPVGIGWMLAVGTHLLRLRRPGQKLA